MPKKLLLAAIVALVNIKECTNGDAKKKLNPLEGISQVMEAKGTRLSWKTWFNDQKCSECLFFTCKTVAMLKAEEFHPNIKGDEAICRIEKMASNGEFRVSM